MSIYANNIRLEDEIYIQFPFSLYDKYHFFYHLGVIDHLIFYGYKLQRIQFNRSN